MTYKIIINTNGNPIGESTGYANEAAANAQIATWSTCACGCSPCNCTSCWVHLWNMTFDIEEE